VGGVLQPDLAHPIKQARAPAKQDVESAILEKKVVLADVGPTCAIPKKDNDLNVNEAIL